MKITTSQVKTLHTIDIQFKDFSEIFCAAKADEWRHNKELGEFDLTDTTIGNIRKCFEALKEPKSIQYIVRKLGFDGVENYGYYDKRKGVYSMVVYDNGDTMNGNYLIHREGR